MKKILLFIVAFMLATIGLYAQSFNLLNHHNMGGYYVGFKNLTEMRDGQIMASVTLSNLYEHGIYPLHGDYGYCHLSVSRDEALVTDSIVVEDNYTKFSSLLFEPNLNGDDYVFVRIVHDIIKGDSLHISRYDESLAPFLTDVSVPLEETVGYQTHFCQGNNDFIVAYNANSLAGMVLSRYGFDGTLKNKVYYHDSVCPSDGRLKVWNEARTEYLLCGLVQEGFTYWILDSTLNIIDSTTFKAYEGQGSLQFLACQDNDITNVDDETYLVFTHYTSFHEGVVVSKRDKATHENIKKLYFKKKHPVGQWIIGMDRSSDGMFYLVFWEEYLKVVKFDENLNIDWERTFYGIPNTGTYHSYQMKTLTHGGLAIGGFLTPGAINDEIFVLVINDDGTSGTPETEAFIRPYDFWPNPVQNELHVKFSPDVKPMQIELYDLQGHLVHTQTKGLERVNMQDLTPGNYLMKMVLEDGKTCTDKVIKE